MFPLFRKTVSIKHKSLLIYILICVALVWMYVAIFPSFSKDAAEMTKVFENFPAELFEAFDVNAATMLTSIEGFLSMEQYSIMWPIIVIILVISLGASAFAAEVEQGTIEVLLSQPLSRAKIFWAKYLAGLFIIFLFVFFSVASILPFARLHNVAIDLSAHFWMGILGLLFAVSIYSMAILFSSIFSSKGKVSSAVAGILIFMYAADILASLKESLDNLRYVSFFYYFDHNVALLERHIASLSIAVFLSVTVVCTLVGLVVFTKRDIAV
ncbi:ABC transporter permease subunit [Patescibacteria group bacterium]|nr:ABC transporter permease subunit [Patescibacteria group bacterium]